MSSFYRPKDYVSILPIYETQIAIGCIKRIFEDNLMRNLHLRRVSAPLFVPPESGLNDDLSGKERPVEFSITETGGSAQIVHSLAKWKRMALHNYGFPVGEGIYTDMNAIRRDEQMDNLHSIYVDQWDWEKVIDPESRNIKTLKDAAISIVNAICDTAEALYDMFPVLVPSIRRDLFFITAQELEDLYPEYTPKERENALLKEHKTAFLSQIGKTLRSGTQHDSRAPDYDDWSLNGDILVWDDTLQCAVELSSMGIRVDSTALDRQLNISGCNDRRNLPFHRQLLAGELPQTLGGGIGQSRLCMILLKKAHIGEVQVSVWDNDTLTACKDAGIALL